MIVDWKKFSLLFSNIMIFNQISILFYLKKCYYEILLR